MDNTIDIMDKGFAYLVEKLGVVNAERFIAAVKRENFDYTLWRRDYFDRMNLEGVNSEAVAYAAKHPHKGHGIRI